MSIDRNGLSVRSINSLDRVIVNWNTFRSAACFGMIQCPTVGLERVGQTSGNGIRCRRVKPLFLRSVRVSSNKSSPQCRPHCCPVLTPPQPPDIHQPCDVGVVFVGVFSAQPRRFRFVRRCEHDLQATGSGRRESS